MGRIRKFAILLALCLVLAALPITSAAAAQSGNLWLRQIPTGDGLTIAVCADTAVASGVITITYDSDVLSFQELTVDSAYVLAHAANDKEAGTVQISWIGTGSDAAGEGYALLRLRFEGNADQSAVLTGTVYDAAGNTIAITTLNLTGATAAVMEAETLKAEDYTADSFASVQAALQEADDLLALETVTQAQLDAAAQKLTAAVENLVVYVPEPTPPTPTEPAPTDPAPTEPTQPGSTPAQSDPTQPSATPAPQPQPQGDNSWMVIAVVVLCAVAVVAAVVILKKRGKK